MIANVNPETGIRYGIISANNLDPEIIDTIQHQGTSLTEAAALAQIRLEVNREIANGDLGEDDFDDEVDRRIEEWCEGAGSEEVHSYTEGEPGSPDRLEVQTTWLGGALHVFCFRSPRLTTARLCSPCVPNCGDLDSLDPNGYDCYDVPPDWRRESESAETEAEVAPDVSQNLVLTEAFRRAGLSENQLERVVHHLGTPMLEGALAQKYGPKRIGWELERTASGDSYYGNALWVARDLPGITDEDRVVLDKFLSGTAQTLDCRRLSEIAFKIFSSTEIPRQTGDDGDTVYIKLSPENENEDVRTADDLFGFIRNELENANIGAYLQLEKNGRELAGSTSEDPRPLVRLTEDEVRELVVPGDYLTIGGLTKFAERVQDALIKKNDAEKS